MQTEADAIVQVRFLTQDEGGKTKAPIPAFGYRATFEIDGECHDAGFLAKDLVIELGNSYEIPVFFLCPSLVLPKLFEGKPFTLWEGRAVASGKVLRVLTKPPR
jgi:hypothetical protein